MIYAKNGIEIEVNSNAVNVFERDGWHIVDNIVNNAVVVDNAATDFSVNEKIVEPIIEEKPKYNRSDITTMPTAKLQALAKELGIENASKTSGNKLKPIIIKALGL